MAESANKRKAKKIPTWVWQAVLSVMLNQFAPLLLPVATMLLGALTAVLFLLKAGLLQLAKLPVSAVIVLIIIEVVLVAVVFGLAIVYASNLLSYVVRSAIAKWLHDSPPERPFWLRPVDRYATMVAVLADAIMERQSVRDDEEAPPSSASNAK